MRSVKCGNADCGQATAGYLGANENTPTKFTNSAQWEPAKQTFAADITRVACFHPGPAICRRRGFEAAALTFPLPHRAAATITGKLSTPFPTMVTKLLHTRYRVTDLEKTVAFYRNVIGLTEVDRKVSPRGSKLVFLKAPQSEELIEICEYPASGPVIVGPDITHLAFEVEDLAAFARHAAAKGSPLSDGPTTTSSGSVIAFVDAPEGYEVEIIQRPR
jgi:lactoylglutathione lyase